MRNLNNVSVSLTVYVCTVTVSVAGIDFVAVRIVALCDRTMSQDGRSIFPQ